MDKLDYLNAATDAIEKLKKLQTQREAIDAEAMKLEQFVVAAANMLPDDGRDVLLKNLELTQELSRIREVGLTDAIRTVLKSAREWLSVTTVRDHLIAIGFNFSGYSANPLASVSTVLRRLSLDEVERKTADGIAVYRWRARPHIPRPRKTFGATSSLANALSGRATMPLVSASKTGDED